MSSDKIDENVGVHNDDSNESSWEHLKLSKFTVAVDMMRMIAHPLKWNEILLFASINENINIYSFHVTKQTYTLLETKNTFHDIYNHAQFFELDLQWKVTQKSENKSSLSYASSIKDKKINIDKNVSNTNYIQDIHIDTVCNYYNSKTQSHYIVITGTIEPFGKLSHPIPRQNIPFCQFFNLNTMKWQEILTSKAKTIKKNINNNNDINDDGNININDCYDANKIVQSRNWLNLHTKGHRSLIFKNKYFLLSGGSEWANDMISIFEICCVDNEPSLIFIVDIKLNDNNDVYSSINNNEMFKYRRHGFVLVPQHIMDNLSKDDNYNSKDDDAKNNDWTSKNTQITQMFDESVIINVLLFGGTYIRLKKSFCQLKLTICTNYDKNSKANINNYNYNYTVSERGVFANIIDNPYWMQNWGGHLKTTCLKPRTDRGPNKICRGFSYDIIEERYLIIIGQSYMGPDNGIVFCDTKSKAQTFDLRNFLGFPSTLKQRTTYQWDVSQIKMPYEIKIPGSHESCVVTMYDSKNNINGLQLCVFKGTSTNDGKNQIIFDQNFLISVGMNDLTWQQERIIWIGYFKKNVKGNDNNNDDENDNDDECKCLMSSLPKDIVKKILLFLRKRSTTGNTNAFFVPESALSF